MMQTIDWLSYNRNAQDVNSSLNSESFANVSLTVILIRILESINGNAINTLFVVNTRRPNMNGGFQGVS